MRLIIFLMSVVLFSGCVNLTQKTVINFDGSGTMTLNYATKTNNLSIGDNVGGFYFSESKIRETYTSENSEIKNLKIENSEKDSLVTVNLELSFKDFNKLNSAKGFARTESEWKAENDIYKFKFYILKDSINASIPGMDNYNFKYEFNFPGLVSETNGTRDGNRNVVWEIAVSQFKNNVELNAIIEKEKGGCGMFGIELPLLFLLLLLPKLKNIKHS